MALLGSREKQAIYKSVLLIMFIILLFMYVPPLNQYWTDFYPAVMATFLGIFLGFTLDRILERAQEKETINKVLISIMKELERNVKDFTTYLEERKSKPITSYFTRAQNSAFDSAIGGGYFALMDSETQNKLSELYGQINLMTHVNERTVLMRLNKEELGKMYSLLNTLLTRSIEEHKKIIKYLRARVRLEP